MSVIRPYPKDEIESLELQLNILREENEKLLVATQQLFDLTSNEEWTPATKLPLDSGWYLVTVIDEEHELFVDICRYNYNIGWEWDGVIAWKPKPKPCGRVLL